MLCFLLPQNLDCELREFRKIRKMFEDSKSSFVIDWETL
jgi:hypothetical protein